MRAFSPPSLLLFLLPTTFAFTPSRKVGTLISFLREPTGAASLLDGRTLISDASLNGLYIAAAEPQQPPTLLAGSPLREPGPAPAASAPPQPCAQAALSAPRALAAGAPGAPPGALLLADTGNHVLRALELRGGSDGGCWLRTLAGTPGEPGSVDGPRGAASLHSPWALAVDAREREAWVVDAGSGSLRVLDASHALRTAARGLEAPVAVALTAAAPLHVFVAARGGGGALLRLRRAGGGAAVQLAAAFGEPSALCFTPDGELLLVSLRRAPQAAAAVLQLPSAEAAAAEAPLALGVWAAGAGGGEDEAREGPQLVLAWPHPRSLPHAPVTPAPQRAHTRRAVGGAPVDAPAASSNGALGGLLGLAVRGSEVLLLDEGGRLWSVWARQRAPPDWLALRHARDGVGGARTLTTCAAGKFKVGNGCFACSPGYYCSGGSNPKISCNIGGFQSQWGSTACDSCPPGRFEPSRGSSACNVCPVGKASSAIGASDIATCASCPQGKYSKAADSACTTCEAGFFCPGNAHHVPCPCAAACASTGLSGHGSVAALCAPPALNGDLNSWVVHHTTRGGTPFYSGSPSGKLYLTSRKADGALITKQASRAFGPVFNSYLSFQASFSFSMTEISSCGGDFMGFYLAKPDFWASGGVPNSGPFLSFSDQGTIYLSLGRSSDPDTWIHKKTKCAYAGTATVYYDACTQKLRYFIDFVRFARARARARTKALRT